MNNLERQLSRDLLNILPVMSPDVMQGLINNPVKLRRFLFEFVSKHAHFTTLTPFTVPGGEHITKDFFKTRDGLYVSDNFRNFILEETFNINVVTNEATIGYVDLTQDAHDILIDSGLPKMYVFEDVDIFLGRLAVLIENQWDGKEGALLCNGRANIFYVKVNNKLFTLHVRYWRGNDHEWRCYARPPLCGPDWNARDRVFLATAA